MDFEEAVKLVENTCRENNFGVLLTKSIDTIFKEKLGVDYPKYTIILVCNPKFAKGALDVSENTGLLFPCSFAVYEKEGKVFVGHVSIMKIAPEVGLAPLEEMKPVIDMTGKGVRAIWDKL